MHITFVDAKPPDFCDYVSLPEDLDETEIAKQLATLLSQGRFNVHVSECFLETVAEAEVRDAAKAHGYRIYAKPLLDKSAMAEFFFERTAKR